MNNYIEFKRQRDFGEIISATLDFIKQNFKPLTMVILYYVGPLILISSILNVSFQSEIREAAGSYDVGAVYAKFLSPLYLLTLIVGMVMYTLSMGLIYGYALLYVERQGAEIEISEVWGYAKDNFFMLLATSVVTAVMTIAGTFLLIIPGIYVAISLMPIFIIRLKEGKSLGEAISRSFQLIKGNWWFTFGLLIVLGIMMVLIIGAVSAITGVIFGISAMNEMDGASSFSIMYFIVSIITSFISMIMYVVIYVAVTFLYFSLVEQKDAPGLYDMLDKINDESNTTLN